MRCELKPQLGCPGSSSGAPLELGDRRQLTRHQRLRSCLVKPQKLLEDHGIDRTPGERPNRRQRVRDVPNETGSGGTGFLDGTHHLEFIKADL